MTQPTLNLVAPDTPNSQRVAVLNGPHNIGLAHADIPEPGEGQIRVKIKWVGICGSDVEAFRGARKPEYLATPTRLGHEVAGVIDKIGPGVLGLNVGDKVACRYVWGAFAEYIVCQPFNVKVLPADFPLDEASLLEILPGVIHSAELAHVTPRTSVLITGQGVSGLVLTQVLSLYSPRHLVVTDLKERNLQLAQKYGATHTYKIPTSDTPTMDIVGQDFPQGFDVVIPCLLEGDGMIDAVDCTTLDGRIIMYGCIGVCNSPFDFFKVHRKRLEIYSTEPRRDIDMRHYFDKGLRLVLDGLINTSEMITHRLPLAQIDAAFAMRDDALHDSIHILIDCENAS